MERKAGEPSTTKIDRAVVSKYHLLQGLSEVNAEKALLCHRTLSILGIGSVILPTVFQPLVRERLFQAIRRPLQNREG